MTTLNYLRLIKWRLLGSKQPVPHCRKQQIIESTRNKTGLTVFIETGTFRGDMIEAQKSNFDKLYSIELGEQLYEEAKKRFESNPAITILNGDSGKVLNNITSNLTQPAIFWLDGHYSGDITAKGDLECPIFGELDAIMKKKEYKHTILIDDARLFVGKNDYPTIPELEQYLNNNNVSFELAVVDDVIKVTLN